MFPAPARFQPLTEKYVEKRGEKQLAEKLVKCRKKWICLHATAGAGKTTFVNNLNKRLPEDSAVVIYDCYGGGVFYSQISQDIQKNWRFGRFVICLLWNVEQNFCLERRVWIITGGEL